MKSVEDFTLLEDLLGGIDLVQYAVWVPLQDFELGDFLGLEPLFLFFALLPLGIGFDDGFQKVGVLNLPLKGSVVGTAGVDPEDDG